MSAQTSLPHRFVERAPALITANAVVWWMCYVLSRNNLDPYGDMVEAYSWGINWVWGYDKHPPLSGWVAAAWFSVFPTQDWAFYLLAVANQALAFWWLYLAARLTLPERAAYVACGLGMLVSLFGPDTGFKYNANSAMLPWVAGFTWAMLHAIRRQHMCYALLAGLFAGLTFLSKYYAVVVLGAISIALAIQWRCELPRLVRPGLLAALSAAAFATPHIVWAHRHHWPTLRYAIDSHAYEAGSHPTWNAMLFAGIVAILPTLAWGALVLFGRRSTVRRDSSAARSPASRPRSLGGLSWWVSVGLTVAGAAATGTSVAPKWLIPAWLFYGWWLCERTPALTNWPLLGRYLRRGLYIYWLLMLCTAVILMIRQSDPRLTPPTGFQHQIADDVTAAWRATTGMPLAYVGGSVPLGYAVSFYSSDHPISLVNTDFIRSSWTTREQVEGKGIAVLCLQSDGPCEMLAAKALGPASSRQVFSYKARPVVGNESGAVVVNLLIYLPPSTSRTSQAAATPG